MEHDASAPFINMPPRVKEVLFANKRGRRSSSEEFGSMFLSGASLPLRCARPRVVPLLLG